LTIIERRCLLLLVIEGDLGLRLLLVFDGSIVAVDKAAAVAVDDGSKRCNSRTQFGLSSSCGADCFSEDIVASVESIIGIGIADDDESCISMMMLIFTFLTIDTTIVS
jgi:hypothetical protein